MIYMLFLHVLTSHTSSQNATEDCITSFSCSQSTFCQLQKTFIVYKTLTVSSWSLKYWFSIDCIAFLCVLCLPMIKPWPWMLREIYHQLGRCCLRWGPAALVALFWHTYVMPSLLWSITLYQFLLKINKIQFQCSSATPRHALNAARRQLSRLIPKGCRTLDIWDQIGLIYTLTLPETAIPDHPWCSKYCSTAEICGL